VVAIPVVLPAAVAHPAPALVAEAVATMAVATAVQALAAAIQAIAAVAAAGALQPWIRNNKGV